MSDCGCGEFEPCIDKPNCWREPSVSNFKQRVQEEKTALDEKRGNLEHFMLQPAFLQLPRAERNRLMRQSVVMEQYSQVLFERLEADFQ